MSDHTDVLDLVRMTDPIPDLNRIDPEEIAAELEAIETAWEADRKPPVAHRSARWRPVLVFAAAAVAGLVVFGVPFLLMLRSEPSPVVVDPATSTTASVTSTTGTSTTVLVVTTTPVPPPTAVGPGLTLARAPDIGAFAMGSLSTITHGGPGFIAVGGTEVRDETGRYVGEEGAIWVSEDGLAWERAATFPTGPWITDVIAGPFGAVAVGSEDYDAAVWTSSDGVGWMRVPATDALGGFDIQEMAAVVAGGPGFVAVGRDRSSAGVWTSSDGVTWTRTEDSDLTVAAGPAAIDDVAAGPGGFLAIGEAGFDGSRYQPGTGRRPVAWLSFDGIEWERVADDVFGDDFRLVQVVAGDPGFLVVGENEAGTVLRTSPDGRTWEDITARVISDSPVDFSEAAWDGSRFVVVGLDDAAGVWVARGVEGPWQFVGPLPNAGEPWTGIDSASATESQLVLAGWVDGGLAIWVGTWDQ